MMSTEVKSQRNRKNRNKKRTQVVGVSQESQEDNKDIIQGIYRLARLHTKESWVCVYPAVWGACLAAGREERSLDVFSFVKIILANWISMTIAHCTFCTWNDIADRNFDGKVERTKTRPLPSGMITLNEAVLAFIIEVLLMVIISYSTLGFAGATMCVPIWILSTIYPYMKRVVPWPQLILGPALGAAVFPGWVSISNSFGTIKDGIPIFLATSVWVVYFDTIYATQDTKDDKKIGVKSLAVLLQNHMPLFLSVLGAVHMALLTMTAREANMSAIFWVLGVFVWAFSIPYQISSLDRENPKTGGKVFKMNIMLGLWVSLVAITELFVSRVLDININAAIFKALNSGLESSLLR